MLCPSHYRYLLIRLSISVGFASDDDDVPTHLFYLHPYIGSKGGGESSTAGKGKQPAQAAASPGFSQPALTPGKSFLDAAKSASPRPQSSSQDTKGKGKQRK